MCLPYTSFLSFLILKLHIQQNILKYVYSFKNKTNTKQTTTQVKKEQLRKVPILIRLLGHVPPDGTYHHQFLVSLTLCVLCVCVCVCVCTCTFRMEPRVSWMLDELLLLSCILTCFSFFIFILYVLFNIFSLQENENLYTTMKCHYKPFEIN
jgi:hypothetical protein